MSGNDNEQKTKANKNDSCLKSYISYTYLQSGRGGVAWTGQEVGNGQGRQLGMDMAGSGYIPGADVVLGVHHFR